MIQTDKLQILKSIIEKTNSNYITSLITKPFVIITGNSGTGKTRIALKVAEYFSNMKNIKNINSQDLIDYTLKNNPDLNHYIIEHLDHKYVEIKNPKGKETIIPLPKGLIW